MEVPDLDSIHPNNLRSLLSENGVPLTPSKLSKKQLVDLYHKHKVEEKIREHNRALREFKRRRSSLAPMEIEVEQTQSEKKRQRESPTKRARPIEFNLDADEPEKKRKAKIVPSTIPTHRDPQPITPVTAPKPNSFAPQPIQAPEPILPPQPLQTSTAVPSGTTRRVTLKRRSPAKTDVNPSPAVNQSPPSVVPTLPERRKDTVSQTTRRQNDVSKQNTENLFQFPSVPTRSKKSSLQYQTEEQQQQPTTYPDHSTNTVRQRQKPSIVTYDYDMDPEPEPEPSEVQRIKKPKKTGKAQKRSSKKDSTPAGKVFILLLVVAVIGAGIWIWQNDLYTMKSRPFCAPGTDPSNLECQQCPLHGICQPGENRFTCKIGYVPSSQHTHCIEDRDLYRHVEMLLNAHLLPLLQRQKGDFECGLTASPELLEVEVRKFLKERYSDMVSAEQSNAEFDSVYSRYILPDIMSPTSKMAFSSDAAFRSLYTTDVSIRPIQCQLWGFWQNWKWMIIIWSALGLSAFLYGKYVARVNRITKAVIADLKMKHKEEEAGDCGIPIVFLRDTYLPVGSRFKAMTWASVISRISNDSRIVETQQLLNGDVKYTWRWQTE